MNGTSLQEKIKPLNSNTEKELRIQLAAVCRLMDHFGWSDVILNHCSARSVRPAYFFMNPYGFTYDEVTASSLVEVDFNGGAVGENSSPVNQAGVVLHSAIYNARSDIQCIIHTHTPHGVAVSALDEGLMCHDQMSCLFHESIGYHDFEGIAMEGDERQRFAQDLGKNKCLILRNHGLVATGRSIAEAFWNYYYLEFACRVHLLVLSSNKKIKPLSEAIKKHTFDQHDYYCNEQAPTALLGIPGNVDVMLGALMRMLDKKDSSYRE